MPNYRIEAFYATGDSESSYDTSSVLSPVWTDLAKAKKALRDLKEHHEYYKRDDNERYYHGPVTDEQLKNIAQMPWYPNLRSPWFSINLEGDLEGSTMISEIPYHGYFEHLKCLKIITEEPEDNDMEVYF